MVHPALLPTVNNGEAQGNRRKGFSRAINLLFLLQAAFLNERQPAAQIKSGSELNTLYYIVPLLLIEAIRIAVGSYWSPRCTNGEVLPTSDNERRKENTGGGNSGREITCSSTSGDNRDDRRLNSNCHRSSRNSGSCSSHAGQWSSLVSRSSNGDSNASCDWKSVCSSSTADNGGCIRSSSIRKAGTERREFSSGSTSQATSALSSTSVTGNNEPSPRLPWRSSSTKTWCLLFSLKWLLSTSSVSEANPRSRMLTRIRHSQYAVQLSGADAHLQRTAEQLAQRWDSMAPENRHIGIQFDRKVDEREGAGGPPPSIILRFSPVTPADALPAALVDFITFLKDLQEPQAASTTAQPSLLSFFLQHCLWSLITLTTFYAGRDLLWSLKARAVSQKAKKKQQRQSRKRARLHRELQVAENQLEDIEKSLNGKAEAASTRSSVVLDLQHLIARVRTVVEQLRKAKGEILEIHGEQVLMKARELLHKETRRRKKRGPSVVPYSAQVGESDEGGREDEGEDAGFEEEAEEERIPSSTLTYTDSLREEVTAKNKSP